MTDKRWKGKMVLYYVCLGHRKSSNWAAIESGNGKMSTRVKTGWRFPVKYFDCTHICFARQEFGNQPSAHSCVCIQLSFSNSTYLANSAQAYIPIPIPKTGLQQSLSWIWLLSGHICHIKGYTYVAVYVRIYGYTHSILSNIFASTRALSLVTVVTANDQSFYIFTQGQHFAILL